MANFLFSQKGNLTIENGIKLNGDSFGADVSCSGELVFNTGMMGYVETLTDPSYSGQILVLTYPLVGNYGVPKGNDDNIDWPFESKKIQVKGLIVSEYSLKNSHHDSIKSLQDWLVENHVPALSGVDTRLLTKLIRSDGSPIAKIEVNNDTEYYNPNKENQIEKVSCRTPQVYGEGDKTVLLLDMGCKNNIIRSLVNRGLKVKRVPWNYDFIGEQFDGILISNGPGDPEFARETIERVQVMMTKEVPIMGICMGNQILALASGAKTYKLKYGHRGQNQPCIEVGTNRAYLTSQNHSYAIDENSLPDEWSVWFRNANDQSNEGIKHKTKPFFGVQFHPESYPGPTDTAYLFDQFKELL
jgi:carbamoyl-phosphate synthase small subunit